MRAWALAAVLLLLPVTHAYILVYANGFKYGGDYGKDTYVRVGSVDQIVQTWRDWGFKDVVKGDRIDPKADGIVILGCTSLSDSDVAALEEYVKKGGRVAVDLHCPGAIDNLFSKYGVIRSDRPYRGTILQTLHLPYVDVKGYPVDRPIVMRDAPTSSKYVKMIYAGPSFTIAGEHFSDVFLTPTGQSVAFMGKIGNGEVYASGCLLCSNQLLMANILDWLEDGKIDFPRFEVDRRVYPPVKKVGEPFYDELRISVPDTVMDSMDIEVAYPYNERGFCKLTPVQEREVQGSTAIFRFQYTPETKMDCSLAPVVVSMTWISPDGKITRSFSVPGEYIQVIAPPLSIPPNYLPYIAASLLVILGVGAAFAWERHKKKKLEEMRLQVKALEESMEDLQKKLMTRQITEDVYKKLMERYIAEIEELKAKIKIMEERDQRRRQK